MILDTNALSALADGHKGILSHLSSARKHQLPVIVLGEYRCGLKRSHERSARERWLDEVETIFDILEVTSRTAREYAQLREELRTQGTPIPENDVWIAALCRETGVALLSTDRHFDQVKGIERKSWK